MKCLLENDHQCSKKKNQDVICISDWQCAVLCSILIFIFSAIFTTCASLGYFHAGQTLDILNSDIQLEQEKHLGNGADHPSNNEVLLTKSQEKVMSHRFILDTLMHYGLSLLVTSGMLVYGLIKRKPYYMVPWIFWSAWTYLLIEALLFFDFIDKFNLNNFKRYVVPNLIFCSFYSTLWFIIYKYYTISKARLSLTPRPKPKKVHTQEGLIHTVNPSKNPDPKIYQV